MTPEQIHKKGMEELFDEYFALTSSNMTKSGKKLTCDPLYAKKYILSQEIAMLKAVREKLESMKITMTSSARHNEDVGKNKLIDELVEWLDEEISKLLEKP